MNRYINILVDSPTKFKRVIEENLAGTNPVLSWSKHHLKSILLNMEPNQLVCVWFHIRRWGDDDKQVRVEKMAGFDWAKGFKTGVDLKGLNYFFTTSGTIEASLQKDCDNRLFGYENMDRAIELGLKNESLNGLEIVKLQTVDEILNGKKEVVQTEDINLEFPEENNWRTHYLQFFINPIILKTILKEVFSEISYDREFGFKAYVIEPGLSGAYLIKIRFKLNHREKTKILKIQKKGSLIPNEIIATGAYNEILEITTDTFIHFDQSTSKSVDDFDCCVYNSVSGITVGNYLRKVFKDISVQNLEAFIDGIFKKYEYKRAKEKIEWDVHLIKSYPWRGSKSSSGVNSYTGLELFSDSRQFLKAAIAELVTPYLSDFVLRLFDCSTEGDFDVLIRNFFNFLDRSEWMSYVIDGNDTVEVPISYVHGDFNVGNIMVDEDGTEPRFIDLSQLSENRHAFFDIGKLSVEMEKRIMSDQRLNSEGELIFEWVRVHQSWLKIDLEKDDTPCLSNDYELDKLMRAISRIRWHAFNRIQIHGLIGLDLSTANSQFLMVRLHFFLRMIVQKQTIPLKRLFALKASIDTLDYLRK